MPPNLIIRAGPRAAAHIRAHGLRPRDVGVIPGAAGGPKALGIIGLDQALFADWLRRDDAAAPRVRHLVGASIGAWRFASATRNDPAQALRAFGAAYTRQRYPRNPGKDLISQSARVMMQELFGGNEAEVLGNPHYRLSVLAVRGLGMLQRESRAGTAAGFAAAAVANAVGRRHLRHFVARTVFHDPRESAAFLAGLGEGDGAKPFDAFDTTLVPLSPENLERALVASASIPLVLEGVAGIPGAPPGTYWDGGIIDYHLHLPYHRSEGLVLYPHFIDRIIPGWLDKVLPWRTARGAWLDNVVLVAPSPDYLAGLPYGKLPDRKDFRRFEGDDAAREAYWMKAMGESERLGEEFLRLVEGGGIVERLRPL